LLGRREKLMFRTLKADEIECRVGTINEKGLTLLLYKDARCDMNILDETVGVMGWQREHKELKGNIYCGVSIWDDKKLQWITKWDCGKESNTEAEKGESSDSFKRACVNLGIGRELYSSPFIWISAENGNLSKNTQGKWKTDDKFHVEAIKYDEKKEIIGLSIKNQNNKRVFLYKKEVKKVENNK
jgi:hypothetical protein